MAKVLAARAAWTATTKAEGSASGPLYIHAQAQQQVAQRANVHPGLSAVVLFALVDDAGSPFGAVKCTTFPSSWNMLTSSTPAIGWTLSFFKAYEAEAHEGGPSARGGDREPGEPFGRGLTPWSFLSSPCAPARGLTTTLRRGVPLPPAKRARVSCCPAQNGTRRDGSDTHRFGSPPAAWRGAPCRFLRMP